MCAAAFASRAVVERREQVVLQHLLGSPLLPYRAVLHEHQPVAGRWQRAEFVRDVEGGLVAFCVNLLDAQESNITPRNVLPFGKYETVEATTVKRANVEIWRWLAVAALAVLMFEWWFYHKRGWHMFA